MVKPPFQIIEELLVGLFSSIISTFNFIIEKMVELFYSLNFIANLGLPFMLISSVIGGIVLYFAVKMIFGNTKSLIKVMVAYFIFIIIITLLFSISKP